MWEGNKGEGKERWVLARLLLFFSAISVTKMWEGNSVEGRVCVWWGIVFFDAPFFIARQKTEYEA